jgi:hypothetical protein
MIFPEPYHGCFEFKARIHDFAMHSKRLRQAYVEPSADPFERAKIIKQIFSRRTRVLRSDKYRGPCACGEHCWAVLTRGYVTFVSPQDAWLLATKNSYALISCNIYAQNNRLLLHREILGGPLAETNHRDHDGLNNRRENLRPCTRGQNQSNSRSCSASGFRGVWKKRKRWAAKIKINGVRQYHLGTFDTPIHRKKLPARMTEPRSNTSASSRR